jgi:hypothetical protein
LVELRTSCASERSVSELWHLDGSSVHFWWLSNDGFGRFASSQRCSLLASCPVRSKLARALFCVDGASIATLCNHIPQIVDCYSNHCAIHSFRVCHAASGEHVLDEQCNLAVKLWQSESIQQSSRSERPIFSLSLTTSTYQRPALPSSSPQHHCQTSTQPISQTPSRLLHDRHPLYRLSSCA